MSKHVLEGCRITPISHYLKALGVFKILSKKDPKILAYWKNDSMILESETSKEDLITYLLNEYEPSPIISPWSYNNYKKTRDSILKDPFKSDDRFRSYLETIKQIDFIFKKFCTILNLNEIQKKDVDDNKLLILKLCRNYFPDNSIPWLDAVYVIGMKKPDFAPILGSGANDGNFNMSENFVKCVQNVFTSESKSKNQLESALFDNTVKLDKINVSGHNPDGWGGPNKGVGFEGTSLSNPWDYVLMMEGMMLFAGSLSKHLSASTGNKAVFPFTADTSNVGYSTSSVEESTEQNYSRGELWLPIWENPASYNEIKHVFNEGRIQLGGKHAKTGTEFARAIVTLGAERGISKFQRFCILKRKGDAYLYINAGALYVKNEPVAYLLDELDIWYSKIIKKSKEKNTPKYMIHLTRNLDKSIMQFCTYRKKQNMLQVLIAMGKLERYASKLADFKPIQKLSESWLVECYDGSAEFRLAASIASIGCVKNVGSIRTNLENIEKTNKGWELNKDSVQFVWKEDSDLLKNMNHVLQRRGIDGKINSHSSIPITGIIPAKTNDIFKFLNGYLDEKKISDLILPLSIINITYDTTYPWQKDLRDDSNLPLSEAYMILKLIHPPNKTEKIPYDLSVINMLSAGLIDNAYSKASYILHGHGLSPLRHSKKSGNPKNTSVSNVVKKHLAASLLFPISSMDRWHMLNLVITPSDMKST